MKKFEYWIVYNPPCLSRLNELGAEGWELVAVTVQPGAGTVHYFKREIISQGGYE